MEKGTRGPGTSRAKYTINKVAVNEFKPCANLGQTTLPDQRLLKGDLLDAVIKTLKAQTALQDALYVLESQLEAALDSDEESGR